MALSKETPSFKDSGKVLLTILIQLVFTDTIVIDYSSIFYN